MIISQTVRRRLTWMALVFYFLVEVINLVDLIAGTGSVANLLILAIMTAWLPIWWYVQHHF